MSKTERPERLTFDEAFDLLALIFACRGTCDRLRTSTVIRDKENILIAAGYNGALSGDGHCDEIGHLIVDGHCLRTNHGEENSILNCLDLSRIRNGTATIVGSPCYPCANKLAAKKIKRIRYIGEYANSRGGEMVEELCRRRGIEIEHIPPRKALEVLKKAIAFLQGPGGPFKDMPKIRIEFEV